MRTMKMFMAGILSVTFLTACNGQQGNKMEKAQAEVEKAEKKLDEAKQKAEAEFESYKADVNRQIDENDRKIAALKEDMKQTKKDAKKEYREKVEALEIRNNELKKQIGEFQNTSEEKWQAFKREFNHDMEELGKAFKDLGTDNKK